MYPQVLTLKPPRSLRLMAFGLIAGAVLLCLIVSDRYAAGCALLMGLMALILLRHRRQHVGQRITLLSEGRWLPADGHPPCTLLGSSTQLAGVFWLHGLSEEGRKAHRMLMPDALADAEDYRHLCVWFRLAAAACR